MKTLIYCGLGTLLSVAAFGTTIDISTGVAAWQVLNGGFVAATSLTVAQQNGTWAPAPAGSTWVSYSNVQGTSCVVGQTPGNGCANTVINPSGDIWTYQLTISAASLGATSGDVLFVFGGDNRVNLFVGNAALGQSWNTGTPTNGNGFNPLGCSATGGPTSAGNTQATYNNCNTSVAFNAANLNGDGSLTITSYVANDPIVSCPACGDPTGFVLEGEITTGVAAVPEPVTFSLVGLAGVLGFVLRRKLGQHPAPGV